MSIYEYYCEDCNKKFEIIKKSTEKNDIVICPICGKETTRVLSELKEIRKYYAYISKDKPRILTGSCITTAVMPIDSAMVEVKSIKFKLLHPNEDLFFSTPYAKEGNFFFCISYHGAGSIELEYDKPIIEVTVG